MFLLNRGLAGKGKILRRMPAVGSVERRVRGQAAGFLTG